jgi:hypothetical protein
VAGLSRGIQPAATEVRMTQVLGVNGSGGSRLHPSARGRSGRARDYRSTGLFRQQELAGLGPTPASPFFANATATISGTQEEQGVGSGVREGSQDTEPRAARTCHRLTAPPVGPIRSPRLSSASPGSAWAANLHPCL